MNAVPYFTEEHKIKEMDQNHLYDVIILGGGPAAMTSAVYCMRKGIDTAMIAKSIGGQVVETASVENYMGYKFIEGYELTNKFEEQVKQFDMGYKSGAAALSVSKGENIQITLDDDTKYKTKALIISTGKTWRKLNVPGELELRGRGVAYCATCDGPLFKNRNVTVIGGGNSGVEAAIELSRIVAKVTLIQNLPRLTADKILIDQLNKIETVDVKYSSAVESINGKFFVESITIKDVNSQQIDTLETDGVFIEIGLKPNTEFIKGIVAMSDDGEIAIDCACRTSEQGIFAAGDVTTVPYKQIIIAAGEGAKAALSAAEYIIKHS